MNTHSSTPASTTASLPRLITGVFFLAAIPAAYANATRLPNQDAHATARGNAFVATADNPSAIYYNPAGITQIEGSQVLSESYIIRAAYDYEPSSGGPEVHAKREVAIIPQLYYVYTPEDSQFSYGIGAYAPFGQASDWPASSGFSTIATRNEITFITVAPTVAWKVCDQLSIGVGLQINIVEAKLRSRLVPFLPNELRYEGDDTSYGYNVGVMWKPSEHHVFGLNYQSRSTSNFSGTASASPLLATPEAATFKLPFPDVITLGYSWRPNSDWNIEFAVDRTNWDLLNTHSIKSSSLTLPLVFNWKPSYYYLLGATRQLEDGWFVSAGYSYSTNSVPDSSFNPAVPDMNRHLASVGLGRNFGAFTGYFTYQHGFTAHRTVTGAPTSLSGESPDGRYASTLDAINFSLSYSF